jgi:hypothetical protein
MCVRTASRKRLISEALSHKVFPFLTHASDEFTIRRCARGLKSGLSQVFQARRPLKDLEAVIADRNLGPKACGWLGASGR